MLLFCQHYIDRIVRKIKARPLLDPNAAPAPIPLQNLRQAQAIDDGETTRWLTIGAFLLVGSCLVSVLGLVIWGIMLLLGKPQQVGVSAGLGSGILLRRGLESPTPRILRDNTIAFGVPAAIFFILRMINCAWVLKKFHVEDYIMMPTFFFYVSLLTLINVSAQYDTNLYPPEQASAIFSNPQDIQNRILGSKIVIALEQCMMASTWGVKICIWFFLFRLCRQLPTFLRALRWLLIYIIFGFVFIEIYYYAIVCRPFDQYWAMPVEDTQCATYGHYSIAQMVFNISSDIGLVILPCVMFLISRLPPARKALLMVVFSMAIFTIIAAIMNKYFNFKSPLTTTYQLWYIREASVSILVGNIICIWQLLQRVFRLKSFDCQHREIVAQPEMGRRRWLGSLRDSRQYSGGGNRSTPDWRGKQGAIRKWAGSTFGSVIGDNKSTTEQSRPAVNTVTDAKRERPLDTVVPVVTIDPPTPVNTTFMTLDRDGGNAWDAIAYCNIDDTV